MLRRSFQIYTKNHSLVSSVLYLSLILTISLIPSQSFADTTSPRIKEGKVKYTNEKANTFYYGTHSSGRLVEASELRIEVESLISNGEWELALPKARKAVQLDTGDPGGHILLAKVLTNKFYQKKGPIDEQLLSDCIREWNLIRYHDADPSEQWEAGNEAKRLEKIAKLIAKEKKIRAEQKQESLAAKDQSTKFGTKNSNIKLANTSDVKNKNITEEKENETNENSSLKTSINIKEKIAEHNDSTKTDTEEKDKADNISFKDLEKRQIATKKRRFGLF